MQFIEMKPVAEGASAPSRGAALYSAEEMEPDTVISSAAGEELLPQPYSQITKLELWGCYCDFYRMCMGENCTDEEIAADLNDRYCELFPLECDCF